MLRAETRSLMCGSSWCVLLWGHMAGFTETLPCSAAVAEGVLSSITFFKGGREGHWSSKSLLRESLGQLVLMEINHALLHHVFVWAGGVQVMVCQVHNWCRQGSSHPSSATSLQKDPYRNSLTVLPCQWATLRLGSCSPCSDLRRDTENDTIPLPRPLGSCGQQWVELFPWMQGGVSGARVPWAAPL